MSSADTQPKSSEAQRLLRSAAEPVAYDLEAGLLRHRQLVADGTTLPDWASEPAPGRSFGRMGVLGGLAVLMVALGYLLGRPATPALPPSLARVPSIVVSEAEGRTSAVAPNMPARALEPVRGESTPSVEPIPAPPEPRAEPPARAPLLSPLAPPRPGFDTAEKQPAPEVEPASTPLRATSAPRPRHGSSVARATTREPSLPKPVSPVGSAAEQPEPATDVVARLAAGDTSSLGASPIGEGAPAEPLPSQPSGPVEQPELTPEQPEVLAEMEQLKQAEQLLPLKPERTLTLVRAGFQRFRPGYLNQERRYLEVMALLGMGKVDDARLLGKLFLRDYPAGPYRRKVESALAR